MQRPTVNCDYPVLPQRRTDDGAIRRLGVEVEFAGLDEETAARTFAGATGATLTREGTRWMCDTDDFGTCTFYLDTRFRSGVARFGGKAALDIARRIVPVELVADPFDPHHLPAFDAALAQLRDAGATGSTRSVAHGFGVHLNVEVASGRGACLARTASTFAMLEPLVRKMIDLDLARRMLPFVDPYPRGLVSALAGLQAPNAAVLARTVLDHSTSRNHGLDLLPVLEWAAPETVTSHLDPDTKNTPRPAFHYRLPDCRIDQPGWGIRCDWRIWCWVEAVAAHAPTHRALCTGWRDWTARGELTEKGWIDQAEAILKAHDMTLEATCDPS